MHAAIKAAHVMLCYVYAHFVSTDGILACGIYKTCETSFRKINEDIGMATVPKTFETR